MHSKIELIIPPTDDIETAVSQVMAPYNECSDDEDGASKHAFWDWYVIGGRWAGSKLEARIGQDRLKAFREKLVEMKVTVSGVQAGKQSLEPKSQIPVVDALWREMFPDSGIAVCPLFAHSNDQYKNETISGDICKVSELPDGIIAERVIIAGYAFSDPNKIEAKHMLQEHFWNGTNHQKSAWNCHVKSALDEYQKELERYKDEYRAKNTPTPDWLVVTVDYHS